MVLTSLILLSVLLPRVVAYDPSPSPTNADEFSSIDFDFIIVGGGTSGLVVASHLSENPDIMVGVLEVGQYRPGDPLILTPGATGPAVLGTGSQNQSNLQANPTYDWMFNTVPQPALGGNIVRYPSGKVVGGSSAINTMIWQRASASEYDLWGTTFGNGDDWSWSSLLPFFIASESWTPPPIVLPGQEESPSLSSAHGTTGNLNISYNNFMSSVEIPAVASANQFGLPTSSDTDSGNTTGFAYMARVVNPVNGARSYAANAFYEPYAGRSNYKLLSEARVTKVLFTDDDEPVAIGVEYNATGQIYTASVKREVIIAAGALQTPKVLELSGVGNKTILEALGIDVVLDSPYLGENLMDHPVAYSDFQLQPDIQTLDWLTYNQTFAEQASADYAESGTGSLSYTNGVMAPATLQSFVSEAEFAELMDVLESTLDEIVPSSGLHAAHIAATRDILNKGDTSWVEFVLVPQGGIASVPRANTSYATAVVILLHPLSQGSVHIVDTDPRSSPTIDPNFGAHAFDVLVLQRGAEFVRKWMTNTNVTAALGLPDESMQTDEDWERHVREHMGMTVHYMDTAAMAPRKMGGVVSPTLKVYGLANVRIVDASILP